MSVWIPKPNTMTGPSCGQWTITQTRETESQKQNDTIGILDQIILCCEGCPVHFRMFSSISDLYPLDNSSTFLVVAIKNVPKHCQMSLVERWQNCPQLRTTGLQQSYSMKSPENMEKSRCRGVGVRLQIQSKVCRSGNRTWYGEEFMLINASECSESNLFSVLY